MRHATARADEDGVLAYLESSNPRNIAPLVCDLIPRRLQQSVAGWSRGRLPAASALAVGSSILVGAITHIAWDAFTHSDGFVVSRVPAFSEPLATWQGYTLYVFKFLQHGSTALGLGALALWGYLHMPPEPPHRAPDFERNTWRVWAAGLLLFPPAVVGLLSGAHHVETSAGVLRQAQQFLRHGIFAGGSALLAWVFFVAVGARLAEVVHKRAA